MRLYTTGEFISNDILFEKKAKNNRTTKMKLYTTGKFISNDISFEKKNIYIYIYIYIYHYKNETLHN